MYNLSRVFLTLAIVSGCVFSKGECTMSYNDDHYKFDRNGNFSSKSELNRAASNGDVQKLSGGTFWDKQTGSEYWSDGTKKN